MISTSEIELCVIIITNRTPTTNATTITTIAANLNRYITAASVVLHFRFVHFLIEIYHIRCQVCLIYYSLNVLTKTDYLLKIVDLHFIQTALLIYS
jgi:hypothetical protein